MLTIKMYTVHLNIYNRSFERNVILAIFWNVFKNLNVFQHSIFFNNHYTNFIFSCKHYTYKHSKLHTSILQKFSVLVLERYETKIISYPVISCWKIIFTIIEESIVNKIFFELWFLMDLQVIRVRDTTKPIYTKCPPVHVCVRVSSRSIWNYA